MAMTEDRLKHNRSHADEGPAGSAEADRSAHRSANETTNESACAESEESVNSAKSGAPGARSSRDAACGGGPGTAGVSADADSPSRSYAPAASRWAVRLVAVGLVLAALNLRPAISALGPLLKEVRADLGMSGAVAGLLTSVPALCFAVFGSLAPRLARRRGPAPVVLAGMVTITVGLVLRPLAGGTGAFLAASALALAGIAVSNVLMPVVVKRWFPSRVGTMTGLYSMGLALGTAGAAAVTVPMTGALGGSWRAGLGAWALLGVLAILPWAFVLKDPGSRRAETPPPVRGGSGTASSAPAAPGEDGRIRIGASPTAWALGVFFGLQASAAYIIMGWLPQIFRDAGVSASSAGLMLAVTMGMGVPLAFVVPRLATRMRHQGPLVAALGVCGITGYAGLWLAPAEGAWLWALLLGVANCAFPVALTMISLRSRSSAGVVKLSAFAQSTGYLLSIPGPLLVGALRDATGGWHAPLLLMAALLLAQTFTGVLAGRDRVIEDGR
ncbi:CynX/NimT family MFS transporter [Streptomyces nanshensis]|uniref:CynX/NimT family MFS transporter n=1 Tax=Streptomyces nanshensis TaxID=518642 RepID=UPI001FD06F47|nr:MFS transporter [Streptomyces nanshensis]